MNKEIETHLNVDIENILSLSEEEYCLARKNGLGASDASVYLGLMNKFKTLADLINDKATLYQTDADRAIGEKDVVRKGKELEPFILDKAEQMLGHSLIKPTAMYRHKEFDFLTINFDGVMDHPDGLIPVECKFVSTYGTKYYNTDEPEGIPEYYIAQVQQQILGLDAPYGYLAALFDKGWKMHIFKIEKDLKMINRIIMEGYSTWALIEKERARRKI